QEQSCTCEPLQDNRRTGRVQLIYCLSRQREQTHCLQIVFSATFSEFRNSIARAPFNTSAKVVPRKFPNGGWKKHGRTSPFGSTTADTQGALHRGATCGSSPAWARKCA